MPGVVNTPEKFWAKVDIRGNDECWLWTRSRNTYGYGSAVFKGWTTNAHRIAYFLAHGSIDATKVICHSCDNRLCCNPAHLWEGTQGDNVRDCNKKGRGKGKFSETLGKDHPRHLAKMTPDQVKEARRLYWSGQMSQAQLGKKYGVHPATISRTVRGQNWNYIPLEERYAVEERIEQQDRLTKHQDGDRGREAAETGRRYRS